MTLAARQPESNCQAPIATDGELLMRFLRRRDRTAIGELVEKHPPMVMAVCRQVLGSHPDAEDAFQATFLILARRAGSIERKSSVAGWLYRVAHRTAMRLARRRHRRKVEPLVEEPPGDFDVFSIIHQRELQRALHEELECLPARYRDPIVLMYFADMSREEIADELECTDATVKGRLARGRKVLRLARARRGVGLSVAVGACVAATPAAATALPALVDKAVLACTSLLAGSAGAAPMCLSQTIQLANEGVRAMTIATLTKTLIVPAALGVAIIAAAQIPGDGPADSPRSASAAGRVALAAAADSPGADGQSTGDDAAVPFVAPAAESTSNETTQPARAAKVIGRSNSNTENATEGLSVQEAQQKLKLDFRDAPWDDVLEWFANEAGLSFDWDVLPKGTFNYSDPDREFTVLEAMDLLNKHLLVLGYALVRSGETLTVIDLDDETDLHTLRELLTVTPLENLHQRGDYELTKVVFDLDDLGLQRVNAKSIADEIEPLRHPQGFVVVMPQARQILVTDTGATVRTMHAVLQKIERLTVNVGATNRVVQPQHSSMPFTDSNAALLQDVPSLDAASLQMLEDYYTQRAQASAMRQKAKTVEVGAYNRGETGRQRELDRAKQMEAEADIVDLRAEEALYSARAKLLREKREEAQTPIEPDTPAAVLAPGDRVLVRLILWSNIESEPPEDVDEVTRVELGGTLPLGPRLGRVNVAGKTLQQAEDEVRKAVAKHYREGAVQITHAANTPNRP